MNKIVFKFCGLLKSYTAKKIAIPVFTAVIIVIAAICLKGCVPSEKKESGDNGTKDMENAETDEDKDGALPPFSTACKVLEVISDDTLLVEIICDTKHISNPKDRYDYELPEGTVVKLLLDRVDWRGDKLSELVDVGSVIEFDRFYSLSYKVDFSQEPFVVKAVAVRMYGEGRKTVIFSYDPSYGPYEQIGTGVNIVSGRVC